MKTRKRRTTPDRPWDGAYQQRMARSVIWEKLMAGQPMADIISEIRVGFERVGYKPPKIASLTTLINARAELDFWKRK